MRRLAAAALALLAGPAWRGAPLSEPVFACALGAKRVEVVANGARLTYRFGAPGRPELELSGDPASGNLAHFYRLYARGEDRHLRVRNGRYSYVVFSVFNAPNHDGEGAVDVAGLLVLDGDRLIARMECLDSATFSADYPYDTLPRDGTELDPLKWPPLI